MNSKTHRALRSAAVTAALLILTASLASIKAGAQEAAGQHGSVAGTWTVDPAHTDIGFAIRHMGISTVRGRFDDVSGTIVANPKHVEKSSVTFTIQTASIDTFVKMRDDDLRSASYFDAAKYPTITFVSTSVQKGSKGKYLATGNLTMHGVTKQVSMQFDLNGPVTLMGSTRIGATSEIHLQRLDYGIGPTLPILGNDVDVTISLEASAAK